MNNRKKTKGRIIQSIVIPKDKTQTIEYGETKVIVPHPLRGKTIQIKHMPPVKY